MNKWIWTENMEAGYWMYTLLEKMSLLSKWEQRKIISTAVLALMVSSAWMVIAPMLPILLCPLLLWSLMVKLRLCLVTIWTKINSISGHLDQINKIVINDCKWIHLNWPLTKCNVPLQGNLDLSVLLPARTIRLKIKIYHEFISYKLHLMY